MKKRKKISFLLIGLMIITAMSLVTKSVFAESFVSNHLDRHQDVYAGYDYTGIDEFNLYNPLNIKVDKNDAKSDFSFWHFVDTSRSSSYAEITFEKEDGSTVTWNVVPCKNNQHFAVITPSSWKLKTGISYSSASGNFNLSHSARHEATVGTIIANASVDPYYYEITPHLYYERTVDEFYERTVDEFYERTVTAFYERPIDKFYNRYAQRYLIPVFRRKVNSIDGTLVTRLNYNNNTKNATATNGGAFKNGHTYVAIDVNKASQEGGIWYTIADSSKNNGKKTPNQYNRPIDYKYNVSIKDNKLTVSFNENLAYASVGAEVVSNTKKFSGHAPKHYKDTVTVDLPSNNGTVYLYTHIEKLGWYNGENEYEFVEWKNSRTTYDEEYSLIDTQIGSYELKETKYGEYNLVGTNYGEYQLKNTTYGEYVLVDTQYDRKKIDVSYTSNLILTVDGVEMPLDEELELEIGVHSFTISSTGNEFEPITKEVNVKAGENDSVSFDIEYQLDDKILAGVEHKSDKTAIRHEADEEAVVHQKDLDTDKVYSDDINEVYSEDYIYHNDIYLGDSENPFGEFAYRLN